MIEELAGTAPTSTCGCSARTTRTASSRRSPDGSADRKPGPGMALAAAQALGLDLTRSWVVGDSDERRGAGPRGRRPTRSGSALQGDAPTVTDPSRTSPTAVGHILRRRSRPRPTARRPTAVVPAAAATSRPYLFAEHYAGGAGRALATVDVAGVRPGAEGARRTPTTGTPRSSRAATVARRRSPTTSSATTSRACATAPTCTPGCFSLSTNVELFSAIANDIGYDAVFEYQLRVAGPSRRRAGRRLVVRPLAEHRAGAGVGGRARHADHRPDRVRRRRRRASWPTSPSTSTPTTTGSSRTRTRPACTCSPSTSGSRG